MKFTYVATIATIQTRVPEPPNPERIGDRGYASAANTVPAKIETRESAVRLHSESSASQHTHKREASRHRSKQENEKA